MAGDTAVHENHRDTSTAISSEDTVVRLCGGRTVGHSAIHTTKTRSDVNLSEVRDALLPGFDRRLFRGPNRGSVFIALVLQEALGKGAQICTLYLMGRARQRKRTEERFSTAVKRETGGGLNCARAGRALSPPPGRKSVGVPVFGITWRQSALCRASMQLGTRFWKPGMWKLLGYKRLRFGRRQLVSSSVLPAAERRP